MCLKKLMFVNVEEQYNRLNSSGHGDSQINI